MRDVILDDFEDLSGWAAFAPGEARLRLASEQGQNGRAMRLDYDFHGGGGFVVARKEFRLEIPESYSFGFHVRGAAPRNPFEFKLVDASNRNVWRYRAEEFAFPEQWQFVRIRSSQIEFAWGPLGRGPARDIAAVELVIVANPGGKGTVWFEGLSFRDDTYRLTPRVTASSELQGHDPGNVVCLSEPSSWQSRVGDGPEWLEIDFGEEREFGGLVIRWEGHLRGRQFEVQVSPDGLAWVTVFAADQADSAQSYIYLPHTLARHVRLNLLRSIEGLGFGIRAIEVKPHDFSRSINHFFEAIARDQVEGHYPKYLLGRQTYWTPVGTGEGDGQALLNEEGMVEVDKGAFSIAPFLYSDGRLITWADSELGQELMGGYLPIPSVDWKTDGLAMKITAFAAVERGRSTLYLRYHVENTACEGRAVALFAAILPFQVTPTWQNWRAFGGVSPIRELSFIQAEGVTGRIDRPQSPDSSVPSPSFHGEVVWVNGNKAVVPLVPAAGFGAAAFSQGGVTDYLAVGELPLTSQVRDEFGYASGALRFDLDLSPGGSKEIVLAVPFGSITEGLVQDAVPGLPSSALLDRAVVRWESVLDAVQFHLPPQAQAFAHTLKTAAAHILIHRDGPALHPGPRRYSRSWIRDGVVMGAALLRLGFKDALRDFMRWYSGFLAEDGRIPDCADREGTEWLPEYDAYGQFLFAAMEDYRFTADPTFLQEMRPAMAKALAFMEGLLSQRLSDEYLAPERRAYYGLLPESMSHEGYMAHPVHAYWDDFWALRGLRDAAAMASILGDRSETLRLAGLRDRFSGDLRTSLVAAIAKHAIDYVPGSVELGDFDPAATSIALSLLDELPILPRPEIDQTFDKYMEGFRQRAGHEVDWNNYSAYEIRIIGALVRLGRRQDALDLARFMLADRRIPAWNQWPEISWRDPLGPSFIGDLPHTWIAGEYVLAARSLFAYEREEDESLVLAAGVDPDWLAGGSAVGVDNLPTHYGRLSYRMSLADQDVMRLRLEGEFRMPGGGVVVRPPLCRPIRQVEVNGRTLAEFGADSLVCREWPADVVVIL